MTEAAYQAKLIRHYEAEGWTVLKLMQVQKAGYPDLLLLKPDAVRWVEVKGPKGRTSKMQNYRIAELRGKGFTVEILRS
jgi:Holliday junction resolvase-like predicted endonuclease